MPHRRLVKIGEAPKLPTIQEFFVQMAERQNQEIRRLKAEVAGQPESGDLQPHPTDSRIPVPDPWLLHPVRVKRAPATKKTKPKTRRAGAKGKVGAVRRAKPVAKRSAVTTSKRKKK